MIGKEILGEVNMVKRLSRGHLVSQDHVNDSSRSLAKNSFHAEWPLRSVIHISLLL